MFQWQPEMQISIETTPLIAANEPEKMEETGWRARANSVLTNQPALIVVIIATVGSLALLCLFAYLLLRPDQEEEPTPTPEDITIEEVDTDTFEYVAVSVDRAAGRHFTSRFRVRHQRILPDECYHRGSAGWQGMVSV